MVAQGGGTPTLANLDVTGKTLLGTMTGNTSSSKYEATEDCIMVGYIKGVSGISGARVNFNGEAVFSVASTATENSFLGSVGGSTPTYKYGMFVPKGTTVTPIGNNYGTYYLMFYSLK